MEPSLEEYFSTFRRGIIGADQEHAFPYGPKRIVYADWTASGRLYRPIEDYLSHVVGPYVANTHTESTVTGTTTTHLYHEARQIIKAHVNAAATDALLAVGAGMTAAVNKFQRILNLRVPEPYAPAVRAAGFERPLVVVTAMEHHSNQTSWAECHCDLVVIRRTAEGLPDLQHLREILTANRQRRVKIGAFTACSNVTGIITPIHAMAALMHEFGGVCFADYAASAPYVAIDMHPADPTQKLDAIYFSPHKFLGGPGSAGILIFDKALYHIRTPDQPGGGTVAWTNPWGGHRFLDDIETREDGGTPGFLQTIKAALAVLLKEAMGVDNILKREEELKSLILQELHQDPFIHILEPQQSKRLGIISFYTLNRHYNLITKLLNDRFGVQARGGCSCAGTYGHILLDVDYEKSHSITCKIDQGDLSEKPGWVRLSVHPTITNAEASYIAKSVREVIKNYDAWKDDYAFDCKTGEFTNRLRPEAYPSLRATFAATGP